jgi:MFS family permease
MVSSAGAGLALALCALWSPIAAGLVAILCVAAATADAGTINAGLVTASEPERRGAFLAVQALSGFGAATVTPMLFGIVLDLAGGSGRAAAWITAFAVQGMIGLIWPLLYVSACLRARRAAVPPAAE